MRLINVTTCRLESFTRDIPPYVILSHMWGADDDEVTFQEMVVEPEQRPLSTTSQPGYEKVLKTCEIAKNSISPQRADEEDSFYARRVHSNSLVPEIQHVLIDTCCIDKSSSAELSEAINSMYRYYQDAVICFAYLSDMTENLRTFETSRWFTRGWTLQELIAPQKNALLRCYLGFARKQGQFPENHN